MNNKCLICKATIDLNWSSLQNKIKEVGDLNHPLTRGFVERCIFCYKNLLELTEKRELEWYQEAMKLIEKRFGW